MSRSNATSVRSPWRSQPNPPLERDVPRPTRRSLDSWRRQWIRGAGSWSLPALDDRDERVSFPVPVDGGERVSFPVPVDGGERVSFPVPVDGGERVSFPVPVDGGERVSFPVPVDGGERVSFPEPVEGQATSLPLVLDRRDSGGNKPTCPSTSSGNETLTSPSSISGEAHSSPSSTSAGETHSLQSICVGETHSSPPTTTRARSHLVSPRRSARRWTGGSPADPYPSRWKPSSLRTRTRKETAKNPAESTTRAGGSGVCARAWTGLAGARDAKTAAAAPKITAGGWLPAHTPRNRPPGHQRTNASQGSLRPVPSTRKEGWKVSSGSGTERRRHGMA